MNTVTRIIDLMDHITRQYGKSEKPAPTLICNDGYKVCVQVGLGFHCTPNVDDCVWYDAVELCSPSYLETVTHLEWEHLEANITIASYVRVEVVLDLLNSHGGVNWDKTNAGMSGVVTCNTYDKEYRLRSLVTGVNTIYHTTLHHYTNHPKEFHVNWNKKVVTEIP